MNHPATEVDSSKLQGAAEALTPSEIRRALSAILESAPFRSSPQIQKVLTFLVLETLAGSGESLKERVIGARLFDRRPDYDTNADPIVRLRVAEVRKRLALYYQQCAHDEAVLIRIPSGSFKASFEWSSKNLLPVTADTVREPEPMLPPAGPVIPHDENGIRGHNAQSFARRFQLRRWWIAVAASFAILTFAMLRYLPSPEERAFNKFWAPVFETSNTVLIGLGNNPLYELSNAGEDEYYKTHPKDRFEEMGLHPYIPLSPGPIDSKFINPAVNTYLTIGDVGALSNIESVLVQ